ncbi:Hypothetical predicted protein [Paramuricea clavata]|uniref:Uncharacterized protein n=1 Tax=Paramuricea clavata TaxID=317549 RepID=A0A6S7HJH2_PARCT|nr:Hypothetical predicted protein [Paramuricea clavata]
MVKETGVCVAIGEKATAQEMERGTDEHPQGRQTVFNAQEEQSQRSTDENRQGEQSEPTNTMSPEHLDLFDTLVLVHFLDVHCIMWVRAVWKEGDAEEEVVIPSNWFCHRLETCHRRAKEKKTAPGKNKLSLRKSAMAGKSNIQKQQNPIRSETSESRSRSLLLPKSLIRPLSGSHSRSRLPGRSPTPPSMRQSHRSPTPPSMRQSPRSPTPPSMRQSPRSPTAPSRRQTHKSPMPPSRRQSHRSPTPSSSSFESLGVRQNESSRKRTAASQQSILESLSSIDTEKDSERSTSSNKFPMPEGRKIMSNKVMAGMNMNGNGGKLAFQKRIIYEIITVSVLKNHQGMEDDVYQATPKLFKYAPDRKGGGGRKNPGRDRPIIRIAVNGQYQTYSHHINYGTFMCMQQI